MVGPKYYINAFLQVCGTDGITYDNICDLKSNSANARVDYRGACMGAETDELVNAMCTRLRGSGRCSNLTGCRYRIRPSDGCCPVCGKTDF
jgi:reversion-inducing cysteine-rich kazal motif protein